MVRCSEQDHARRKIFDVNLRALLMTLPVVTAWMGEHGGAVVNTASTCGCTSLGHGQRDQSRADPTSPAGAEFYRYPRMRFVLGWFAPGFCRGAVEGPRGSVGGDHCARDGSRPT